MKKITKYMIVVLIALSTVLVFIYGFSYAKYVSNSVWNYYLNSKGFYMSSDYLDSNPVKNVNNFWNGESVHFNIKNNLNQSVVTNYDINFTVTCTVQNNPDVECRMNNKSSNIDTGTIGFIDGEVSINDLYFDVINNGAKELTDVTINVDVTSTSPYRKTLIGNFILHKMSGDIESVDMSFNKLDLSNNLSFINSNSENKCMKLTWNSNDLLIDVDKNLLSSFASDENGYLNEIKFNIPAKSSLNYTFYNRNFSKSYDVTDFTLVESEGC